MANWHQKEISEIMQIFKVNEKGISSTEIADREKTYGKNKLDEKKKHGIIYKFFAQMKDVMIIVLLCAAVVSAVMAIVQGEYTELVEGGIILAIVIANAVIGVVQENKAESALDALKNMSKPFAKVIRDKNLVKVPTEDLYPGDIVLLEAGDVVPADIRLLEVASLKIEESALTGESLPVEKCVDVLPEGDTPLGDRKNMAYSSGTVSYGRGKGIVVATGMDTEVGKIAGMLTEEDSKTPLQKQLAVTAKYLSIIVLAIAGVIFALQIFIALGQGGQVLDSVFSSFMTAVAIAVAAIPEGLPAVVTIVLAIGVQRMSEKRAIVRKLPAVETLGSAEVICSDKTGTLTLNKMTVVETCDFVKGDKQSEELINCMVLCNDTQARFEHTDLVLLGDPTETALFSYAHASGFNPVVMSVDYPRVDEIPFDSDRKLMTTVIKVDDKYVAITKGAPDRVIGLTVNSQEEKENALNANAQMANDALRVLALGIQTFDYLPTAEELEKDLTLVGLVGMIDPARPEVFESIKVATKAGIKTVMITGDHIVTACAIARELGILKEGDRAITSQELDELSDEYLAEHIHEFSVFARVAPKDKVRIVEAWQKRDAICAMTGDGVNDAPALKKAEIGCAMGITGTDVSKEAADMILTDDNFSTIVSAVKEGRGIYDNIRKCVKYLLSSNIGEVLTIFVASLLTAFGIINLGTPLAAMHLLWINLITDSLPAFGIGMEEAEDTVMDSKPRSKNEGFFANGYAWKICLEGIIIGAVTLIAYIIGEQVDHSVGQTMAFLTLSSTQLFHAYNVKSNHSVFSKKSYKNKFMNFAFLVGFGLQVFVIYCPGIQGLFKFAPLPIEYFAISIALSLVMVAIMEVYKLVTKLKAKKAQSK